MRQSENSLYKNVLQFGLCLLITGIIINFLLYGYYRRPPKIVVQAATDKIWAANSLIIDRTEGFGTVRTDANGYNNTFLPSDVDNYILLMGSSHTQAINVDQDENYACLLTQRLHQAGINSSVYNVGFDGNEFVTVIQHFKAAMEQFDDAQAIIIEMYKVDYTAQKLRDAISRQRDYDSAVGHSEETMNERIVNFVQAMPLARLVYSRLDTFRIDVSGAFIAKHPEAQPAQQCPPDYQDAINEVMATLKEQAGGRDIILLYNPMMQLEKDGTVIAEPHPEQIEAIARACAAEDIYFHDMTDSYLNLYTGHWQAAHGFANSKIVSGHLNPNGHRAIADDLYEIVSSLWYGVD